MQLNFRGPWFGPTSLNYRTLIPQGRVNQCLGHKKQASTYTLRINVCLRNHIWTKCLTYIMAKFFRICAPFTWIEGHGKQKVGPKTQRPHLERTANQINNNERNSLLPLTFFSSFFDPAFSRSFMLRIFSSGSDIGIGTGAPPAIANFIK